MKHIHLAMMIFLLMIISSCIKQKNCKDCISGKWIYLETPENITTPCENGVVAHFFPDLGQDYGENAILHFVGKVPKNFQRLDTINVCVDFKETCPEFMFGYGLPTYKLKCIENN